MKELGGDRSADLDDEAGVLLLLAPSRRTGGRIRLGLTIGHANGDVGGGHGYSTPFETGSASSRKRIAIHWITTAEGGYRFSSSPPSYCASARYSRPMTGGRPLPRVVVVGAGFGGLAAARSLAGAPVRV